MKTTKTPWGRYEILYEEKGLWVKRIVINPKEKLSKQYHNQREEVWIYENGNGNWIVGNETIKAYGKQLIKIPRTKIHRAEGNTEGLSFIEIATGNPDEKDIVRIEDVYNRTI